MYDTVHRNLAAGSTGAPRRNPLAGPVIDLGTCGEAARRDVRAAPGVDAVVRTPRTVDEARLLRHRVGADVRTAVVVGGGLVGLASAGALHARGVDVTLVEAEDRLLPTLDASLARLVVAALTVDGLHVRTGATAARLEVTTRGAVVVLADGESLPADLVALCGDVAPAGVAEAHADAGEADEADATAAASDAVATTTVHASGLTVAVSGRYGAALDDAPHQTLHLRPRGTTGSTPAHLVVHVGADGLLLGAQAVGAEGVEARLDVLAESLRAAAVLDGGLRLWYPDELDDVLRDALVLDVRSADEFARGHLAGAVNVPHRDVTERVVEVGDVAGGRPVRLHCQTGHRSYAAHRVLAAAGLDSAALSGGLTALLEARPGTQLIGCHRRARPEARPA